MTRKMIVQSYNFLQYYIASEVIVEGPCCDSIISPYFCKWVHPNFTLT
jgi:hypothetical protein